MFRELSENEIGFVGGATGGGDIIVVALGSNFSFQGTTGGIAFSFGGIGGLGSTSANVSGALNLGGTSPTGAVVVTQELVDVDGDGTDDAIEFYDANGNFLGIAAFEAGAYRESVVGSYFASLGGSGPWGSVGGIAITNNPWDLGVWGGVGSPGISASIGWTGNAEAYLNGNAYSAQTALAGTTVDSDGNVIAEQIGTAGVAATYSISARAVYEAAVRAAQIQADGFYDRYVGPSMEPWNYSPQP